MVAPILIAACVLAFGCRGGEEAANTVTLTRPAADAPFDRTFSWKPVPNATAYNIAVYQPDGSRTFEVRDLKVPGVKIADSVQLPPGRYSVQVTAVRDGTTVAESPLTPFDIR